MNFEKEHHLDYKEVLSSDRNKQLMDNMKLKTLADLSQQLENDWNNNDFSSLIFCELSLIKELNDVSVLPNPTPSFINSICSICTSIIDSIINTSIQCSNIDNLIYCTISLFTILSVICDVSFSRNFIISPVFSYILQNINYLSDPDLLAPELTILSNLISDVPEVSNTILNSISYSCLLSLMFHQGLEFSSVRAISSGLLSSLIKAHLNDEYTIPLTKILIQSLHTLFFESDQDVDPNNRMAYELSQGLAYLIDNSNESLSLLYDAKLFQYLNYDIPFFLKNSILILIAKLGRIDLFYNITPSFLINNYLDKTQDQDPKIILSVASILETYISHSPQFVSLLTTNDIMQINQNMISSTSTIKTYFLLSFCDMIINPHCNFIPILREYCFNGFEEIVNVLGDDPDDEVLNTEIIKSISAIIDFEISLNVNQFLTMALDNELISKLIEINSKEAHALLYHLNFIREHEKSLNNV